MYPEITIIKNWIYIDGIKAKKKYMEDWYHSREISYNDYFVVKMATDTSCSAREQNLCERSI